MGFTANEQEKSGKKIMPHKFRGIELRGLILVSIALGCGLFLTYRAKTQRPESFAEISVKLRNEAKDESGQTIKKSPEILNLNAVKSKEELIPFLSVFDDKNEREFAAEKIFAGLHNSGKLANVGALSSITITGDDLKNKEDLPSFAANLDKAKIAAAERLKRQEAKKADPLELVKNYFKSAKTAELKEVEIPVIRRISALKSSFIVRMPEEFFRSLIIYSALFFLAFFGLHIFWQFRGFRGDELILPTIQALCGIGLLMMISLRDPLRDTLSFTDFVKGTTIGCLALGLMTIFDYYDLYYRLKTRFNFADHLTIYAPLAFSLFLSILLIAVGYGPGTSDAKVNLSIKGFLVFQPSELIKILIAFFIAAFFSSRWELIQNLDEKLFKWFAIPRIKDVRTVALCVGSVLVFFVFQKDLGPALLMSGTFLIVFAIVRSQIFLSAAGFLLIVLSYAFNYYIYRFSQTAADRVDIWNSPWDTTVRGGEQIVHSFWALATGGFWGTGLGLGDPSFAPAAHTDLILSSVGEELGFIGLLGVFALYAVVFYRASRIALNASSSYTFFLAISLTSINALQILFISAGVLNLIPLSGVVSPFLSYGSTSMVMNFFAFGVLLVISDQSAENRSKEISEVFKKSAKWLLVGFGLIALLIVGKAAWIQIWKADEIMVKSVLAPQPNEIIINNNAETTLVGIRRYQENPRIMQLVKELPYGTIYDRNGIPLAGSNWDELLKHRQEYENFGIKLESVCVKSVRCYPFGSRIFHLLGDVRTKKNWSASNVAYIEKEYEGNLRGFNDNPSSAKISVKQLKPEIDPQTNQPVIDSVTKQPVIEEKMIDFPILKRDYSELIPLLRYRYLPLNLEAYRLRYKERNIQTSIDIRLQLRLTDILKNEIEDKKEKRGAIVVLEPQTGDLLASVSYPFVDDSLEEDKNRKTDEDGEEIDSDKMLDRARYGFYPPGSTFKIVTALAAFKKDQNIAEKEFSCILLPDGRAGNNVRGIPIRDDIKDHPHGKLKLKEGIVKSCNAFFAQLGNDAVGAEMLFNTANAFNILSGTPNNLAELNKYLPQSSYGQGEVRATPFQIAKVAATIANHGMMPFGRWITDENNKRNEPPAEIVKADQADFIAEAMREVVTRGTGTSLINNPVQIAGKTGTAETRQVNEKGKVIPADSHSWFMGFAPYNGSKQIAFAVIVENGGYGGGIAAQISGELVKAAKELSIIE